ncbi:DUF6985 domain-containing protein [Hydrogenovibrio thermophilus]|uniref:DUF6985 domain-containing protein n=1 Tax=Hydrogenovibrio thermophilus TaxID=265883 RepID=A0A451G544_9GAMM|nr:hypothetical protein [Hydrogenovibrio thermophilus]QAB14617.1 hypothetical protein EPV75_02510 [Hydrogenovibrio thermophilus]
MEVVTDAIFGKMTYMHSWVKAVDIDWWGVCTVKIIASAYKNEQINSEQREAYSFFERNAKKIILNVTPMLRDFIQENYGINNLDSDSLIEKIKPTSVVFERNGTWGILFDSDWDVENGIAVFSDVNGNLKVSDQDSYL